MLTGADASVAGWCAGLGWMRWAHSSHDGLVHGFSIEDSQRDRWLRAACSATVLPAVLGSVAGVGPRCPCCLLTVAAACAAPRRPDWPGMCARSPGCWRRQRHDEQPAPLAWVPDIALLATTAEPARHELPGVAGADRDTACGLVPQRPVCHDLGAAW